MNDSIWQEDRLISTSGIVFDFEHTEVSKICLSKYLCQDLQNDRDKDLIFLAIYTTIRFGFFCNPFKCEYPNNCILVYALCIVQYESYCIWFTDVEIMKYQGHLRLQQPSTKAHQPFHKPLVLKYNQPLHTHTHTHLYIPIWDFQRRCLNKSHLIILRYCSL